MPKQNLTHEERIERAYAPWEQGNVKMFRDVAIALFKDYHQQQKESPERWQKYGMFIGDPSFGLPLTAFAQRDLSEFSRALDQIAIDTAIATEKEFLSNKGFMHSKTRDPLRGPRTGNNFIPYLAEDIGALIFGNRYFPKGLRGSSRKYALTANKAAKRCDRLRNLGCDIWWPVAFPEIYYPPLNPRERPASVLINRLQELKNEQARYSDSLPGDHPENRRAGKIRSEFLAQRRRRALQDRRVMAELGENDVQVIESCGETLVHFYEYVRLLLRKDLGIELPKRMIEYTGGALINFYEFWRTGVAPRLGIKLPKRMIE